MFSDGLCAGDLLRHRDACLQCRAPRECCKRRCLKVGRQGVSAVLQGAAKAGGWGATATSWGRRGGLSSSARGTACYWSRPAGVVCLLPRSHACVFGYIQCERRALYAGTCSLMQVRAAQLATSLAHKGSGGTGAETHFGKVRADRLAGKAICSKTFHGGTEHQVAWWIFPRLNGMGDKVVAYWRGRWTHIGSRGGLAAASVAAVI